MPSNQNCDDPPIHVGVDGHQEWLDTDGLYHRLDGPAYVVSGYFEGWWKHGQRHREDGPAIICGDGREEWWFHDKRHRLDGPAYIDPVRSRWFINDKNITDEVEKWMFDFNIPTNWQAWTFVEKTLFAFMFR